MSQLVGRNVLRIVVAAINRLGIGIRITIIRVELPPVSSWDTTAKIECMLTQLTK